MTNIICKSLNDMARTIQKEVQKDMGEKLFVAQNALNKCAFMARDNLLKDFRGTFKVKNSQFFTKKKGVKVQKADRKKDGIAMTVGLSFDYDWFKDHSFGGLKKSKDQFTNKDSNGKTYSTIAIPIGATKIVKSGARGGQIAGAHAGKLLAYSYKNPKKTVGKVRDPHAFILKGGSKSGNDIIARRQKRNRKKLDFFFVLVPGLKIQKRWDFYGVIQKTFDRHLNKCFEDAEKWAAEHPKK